MVDITNLAVTEEERNALAAHAPFKTGTNGLPELSTSFLSQMITSIKPESFKEIVDIEGYSHKNLTF